MRQTEPIRDKAEVRRLSAYYAKQGQHRNHLLIILQLYTALRISDILNLKTDDVYNFTRNKTTPKIKLHLKEQKTGKTKIIKLNKKITEALLMYIPEARQGTALILNPKTNKAISRIQAHRITKQAGQAVNIEEPISCHSLRKTFGYHAWKNGVSPAIIMEIYNHSSLAVTRRYLGVSKSDMNEVYINMQFNE